MAISTLFCSDCKQDKPDEEFGRYAKNTGRRGRHSYCRKCCSKRSSASNKKNPARVKAWVDANTDKINASQKRFRERNADLVKDWKRFAHQKERAARLGLTMADLLAAYEAQGRKCAICADPIDFEKGHTDHCHKGGHFRGFLCRQCNHVLGFAKDSTSILMKAVEYLSR